MAAMVTSEQLNKPRVQVQFQVREILFGLGFLLYMSAMVLSCTRWYIDEGGLGLIGRYMTIARYGAYGLFLFKFLYECYYDRKQIAIFVVSFALVILSFLGCADKTMVFYCIVFFATYQIRTEIVMGIAATVQCLVMVSTMVASQCGYLFDYVSTTGGERERVRHFFGFTWTTNAPTLWLFIVLEYAVIKKGIIRVWEFLIGLGVSIYLFKMTDSRFIFIVSMLAISILWLRSMILAYKKDKKTSHRPVYIWTVLPTVMAIGAVVLHWCYNESNETYVWLNGLLSGRLKLGFDAIQNYGFTPFGQEITWIGFDAEGGATGIYNYVDCGYLQILLEYGIVLWILILAMYSLIMYYGQVKQKQYLCWILVFPLLFCITEPRLIDLAYNPLLLICVTEGTYGVFQRIKKEKA